MEKNETVVRMTFAERERTKKELKDITVDNFPADRSISVQSVAFWHPKSVRFHIALLLSSIVLTLGLFRISLSMAIVCMVNSTALAYLGDDSKQFEGINETANASTTAEGCILQESTRLEYEGEFVWTSSQQGILFSALFWGGLVSGFPAGFLADRYGAKNLVLAGVAVNTLGSLLTPITAIRGGPIALFVIRFIMGLGQGLVLPCGASIIARWFPSTEKSTVLAIYTAGNQASSIIAMPLNAALCQNKQILGGWPAIFYLPGMVSFIILGLWIFLVTNTPEKNPRISDQEKTYIVETLNLNYSSRKAATKHIPWKSMLTSPAILGGVMMNFTASLFAITLSTYLPTFFKDVLYLDLKSNGLFSALPYVCQWITKFVFAISADRVNKRRQGVSHTLIAKIFNSIGAFGCAALLVAVSFVTCRTPMLGVGLFSIANGMFSGYICGFLTALMSIAPQYTGIVNSLARISGQLGAILVPYLVGWIAVNGTQSEWRTIFLIVASISCASGIIYILIGSAEIQPWAQSATPKPSVASLNPKLSTVSKTYEESEWPDREEKKKKKKDKIIADDVNEVIDLGELKKKRRKKHRKGSREKDGAAELLNGNPQPEQDHENHEMSEEERLRKVSFKI